MMQGAVIAAAKGNVAAPQLKSRSRVSATFGQLRKGGFEGTNLSMRGSGFCFGGSPLRVVDMGAGIVCVRNGVETFFRSKGKARTVHAQAAAGDLEDVPSDKLKAKSSGTVLPFVGVACLGAILFGYHLGVVNGALEYLAIDLGITENTVLQELIFDKSYRGLYNHSSTARRWRTMFGIAIIPSVLLALGMAISPESPRWLVQGSILKQNLR